MNIIEQNIQPLLTNYTKNALESEILCHPSLQDAEEELFTVQNATQARNKRYE